MQAVIIATIVFHVLSGVFWAGSTVTLARIGGAGAEKLFRPQMGAATVAVMTGALLWHLLHAGTPGKTEYILAVGAVSAILAAGVQGVGGFLAARRRTSADQAGPPHVDEGGAMPNRVAA